MMKACNVIALSALAVSVVLLPVRGALAVDQANVAENLAEGDTTLGFDASTFVAAASLPANTAVGVGVDCFVCPNPGGNSGGTTSGALTDKMDGSIRDNADANNGPSGRNPSEQGQVIPTGGNDSGAFVINTSSGDFDHLGMGATGLTVVEMDGTTPLTVNKAGVRIRFSNTFTFNGSPTSPGADPTVNDGGSSFDQRVDQVTFSGGQNGDAVQLVNFGASGENPAPGSTSTGDSGSNLDIATDQAIAEGGFLFGGGAVGLTPQLVTFTYNSGNFQATAAPPGVIGGSNSSN